MRIISLCNTGLRHKRGLRTRSPAVWKRLPGTLFRDIFRDDDRISYRLGDGLGGGIERLPTRLGGAEGAEDLLERRALLLDGLLGHSAQAGHQSSCAVAWYLDQTS